MNRKAVSGVMLTLLLFGLLPLTLHVQPANAPADVQVAIVNPVAIFPWPNWTTSEVFNDWWTLPLNVTIQNLGSVDEDVQVAVSYSNDSGTTWIQIGTNQSITGLPPGNGTILTFWWYLVAANLDPAIYPVKVDAYATNATLSLSASDQQTFPIKVRVLGDVDGDNDVDVSDQRKMELAMFKVVPDPVYLYYNSFPVFTDVDGDGDVDVGDQRKHDLYMWETWPGPIGGVWISVYSPAGSIAVDPPTAALQAGQTLTVSVIVTNITDCAGFQFWINYNPTILQMISWTFDTDPAHPLSPTQLAPSADQRVDTNASVPGSVKLATVWSRLTPTYSYAGSSVAAKLTFQALTTGSVQFILDPVWTHATDNLGNDILFRTYVDSGLVYIRSDGSIDPPLATITTVDKVTYTLTGNVDDAIVVERDDVVVDGAGYTVQGAGAADSSGIDLTGRSNVTIKNTTIKQFHWGIRLRSSIHNTVSGNTIANNDYGVRLESSFDNNIGGNTITANSEDGIYLSSSSYNRIVGNTITDSNSDGFDLYLSSGNTISGNTITNNEVGIDLGSSSNNVISGNTITNNNGYGFYLYLSSGNTVSGNTIANTESLGGGLTLDTSSNNTVSGNNMTDNWVGVNLDESSGNRLYHNNFIDNLVQAEIHGDFPNVWDAGYPSGGNSWSNYAAVDLYGGPYQNETGSDGIGDTPYGIGVNNTDSYPLMSPYPSVHAIAVDGGRLKTVLGHGFATKLYVHVANGHFTETVNVTVAVNSTVVDTLTNLTIPSGNSTITLTWNTTGFAKGAYNVSVDATPVPNETYTTDNTYTYWAIVTIVGDVDGDRDVDVGDQRKVQLVMFTTPTSPNWSPNTDIDGDGDVDVGDQRKQQLHMFESW